MMRSAETRGFSLAEVLVALLLMQFALLALAPLFVFATRSTASSGELGHIGAVAVERMELLREMPFTSLIAGGDLTSDITGFVDTSHPGVVLRWRITDDASPATTKTIEVRVVSSRTIVGRAKELTLVGLVAQ